MDSHNILQAIAGILPVITGGILTILGGVVAAYINHKLTHNSNKEQLEREKLELLVKQAYKTKHWLESYTNEKLFDGDKLIDEDPISELRMLTKLYFPKLEEESTNLERVAIEYKMWVLDGQEKIKDNDLYELHREKFREIYKKYISALSDLVEKAGEIIQKDKSLQ